MLFVSSWASWPFGLGNKAIYLSIYRGIPWYNFKIKLHFFLLLRKVLVNTVDPDEMAYPVGAYLSINFLSKYCICNFGGWGGGVQYRKATSLSNMFNAL